MKYFDKHECDNPGSGSADGDTGDNNDGSG